MIRIHDVNTKKEHDRCFTRIDLSLERQMEKSRRQQRLIERENKTMRNAYLQIFGLEKIPNLIDSYQNVADKVSSQADNLGPSLKTSLENFDVMSDRVSELISSVTNCLTDIKCKVFDTDMTSRLISVINILINVSFADSKSRLKCFFWNVFINFGVDIYKQLLALCQTTHTHELQMGFAISDILSLMKDGASLLVLSVPVMGSLLAILFQILLGLPGKTNITSAIKFFGDRCRGLKNIFDFMTGYSYMFEGVVEFLYINVLGIERSKTDLDLYLTDFSKWAQDILDLGNPEDPLAQRLEKDERLVYKVDTLYRQGLKFASDISEKRLDNKMTLYFQRIFKIIEEARKLCDFTGVFGNKPRMEPLVIQLFGESGVGKSGMTWPLSVDLNALFVSSVEEAQNFSNNIYFRNTEQEFWDGYVGQNIVTYDDFGQRTDSSTNPNEEFMELIRASNIAPYPLHMAELAEKKRTKFNSKVIILTSNILGHNVSSLTFPDAYRRRIDICAKVQVKRDYVKKGFSGTNNNEVERLDTSKCDGPVDTRVYEIVLYNPETMMPINAPHMDYDEFLQHCIDQILVKQRRSVSVNHVLSTRVDEDRFEKIRAKLQVNDVFFDGEKVFFPTIIECEEAVESYRQSCQRYAQQLLTFKNVLILLGVLLAGLGIWKLFSKSSSIKKMRWEAFSSGDNLTNKAKSINVEAISSGDALTHQRRVVAMEAAQSGDSITIKPKVVNTEASSPINVVVEMCPYSRTESPCCCIPKGAVNDQCYCADHASRHSTVVVEASSSGDNLTRKAPIVVTEATLDTQVLEYDTLANLQAWRDCTAQDLISTRILSNLYKIKRVRGDLPLLNGLFIRDTVMLVPRHLELMLDQDDQIEMENIFSSRFLLPVSELRFVGLTDSSGKDKDAMLVQFPRYVNAHADIVKHFQTMPELSQRSANISVATIRNYKSGNTLVVLGNTMASMTSVTLNTAHGVRNVRDCIEYCLNTINGDCGAPVICNEKSFIRKIAGIHIAAANDGSSAFGQSVTQQNLVDGLSKFKNVIVSDMDVMANIQMNDKSHQLEINKEYTPSVIKSLFGVAADTFSYLGKCKQTVFVPNKTDIRQSTIFGKVTEPITKPAYLRHPQVNILKKNLEKCGVNTPFIPTQEVERSVNEYKTVLMQKPIESLRRVLPYEEAISGNELSTYISGLTRSTSPGYPWVFEKKPGMPGKTTWFGNNEYFYDEQVKQRIMRLEKLAKQGRRTPFVWTDTLKDERRPIAKVDELKTRVFAAGPMDYLILFRMYFLGFMANVMENRISNEQSIGTNPFSSDWKKTASKLSRFGDKVFAGDFSTFDGTLNSCIMSSFVDVINEWYDDSEENKTLRRVLFLDIFNSIHLCENMFYSSTHSQPSGNPITTVLNSFYNSVSMRIAFYRCQKAAGVTGVNFDDVVSMVSYGDDNVINFSDSIVDWFNQVDVTEAYATFGMIYTDEAKTGKIIPYKTLPEVAYLKRSFRKENGIWFAPLDLSVCLEMCNWIRDCPNHEAATCDNIEAACRELSVHGKQVFDKWTPQLVKTFYKQTGIYPNVKAYSTYMEDMLAEY